MLLKSVRLPVPAKQGDLSSINDMFATNVNKGRVSNNFERA